MAEKRKQRPLNRGRVRRVERITPHMIRVTIGGDSLANFGAGEYTDHYVKILFPVPGVTYPSPMDMEVVRRELPAEQWPKIRTYTVRSWDPSALELAIDFVYHGDRGVAGPWAARVKPGEEVLFMGPGGAYSPSADADWHLLAGDESALPAIGAALERLPDGTPARVFVEVSGPSEEQPLRTPADAEIVWLHRNGGRVGEALIHAVRGLEFPPGTVHAFVHGEANFVKQLRRHLRVECAIPLEQLSISGYWRRDTDEDGWQSSKRDWNRVIEQEEAVAVASA